MGWFILDKYYNRTDEVPVYSAALLLDPSKRSTYIKKNWQESWIEPAIAAANRIWEKEYKTVFIPESEAVPEVQNIQPQNELARLLDEVSVATEIGDHDDFMEFINIAPIKLFNTTPLQWWYRPEQRERYPKLHKMAITILSIPTESAKAERVFSGARRTCSWDRLRLTCKSIELIECIGNWLKAGLIRPISADGMGLPCNPQENEVIPGLPEEMVDEIEQILEY
jgi:hypothetical protein